MLKEIINLSSLIYNRIYKLNFTLMINIPLIFFSNEGKFELCRRIQKNLCF